MEEKYTYRYRISSEFDGNHILHVKRSDGKEAKVWWGSFKPSVEDLRSFNYRSPDYWAHRN